MDKTQKVSILFLLVCTLYIPAIPSSNAAQSAEDRMQQADSLFRQQKYTQSLQLYSTLLQDDDMASPSMLLKMAFIEEGLGNYTRALYYLNLYYQMTFDLRALKKMETLAGTHHLAGYDYDDTQFFLNLYHRYRVQINIGIMALATLLAAVLLWNSLKYKRRPIFSGAVYILFLLFLLWLNNFGREKPKAIVAHDAVYLMKGPSAGADVVEVIDRGHRVIVLGTTDVWTEIEWREGRAFVKDSHLTYPAL
jgi:uncharacterized protein YgiM (DUF1202 family)